MRPSATNLQESFTRAIVRGEPDLEDGKVPIGRHLLIGPVEQSRFLHLGNGRHLPRLTLRTRLLSAAFGYPSTPRSVPPPVRQSGGFLCARDDVSLCTEARVVPPSR